MTYHEIPPSPLLANYIDSYWFFHNTQPSDYESHILPDCCMDIILHISQNTISVCGVMTTAKTVAIQPGEKLFGIRFHPGILPALLKMPAHLLQDVVVSLKGINQQLYEKLSHIHTLNSPEELSRACDHIFEQEVLQVDMPTISNRLQAETPRGFTVRKLAAHIGTSIRHLERLFSEHIGITPKRFLKIRRFQTLEEHLHEDTTPLASLSVQCGYADQPHMNKEYKQLTGNRPLVSRMSRFYKR